MESDDLQNQLGAFFKKLENIDSKLSELKPAYDGTNRWIYGSEVMRILRISESTLRRRRLKNEIPFQKIGGSFHYPSIYFDKILLEMSMRKLGNNEKD